MKRWWPGTELNRRRQPFQGCALPPELPGHVSKPALRVAGCEDCSLHAGCGRDGCNRSDAGSVRNVFDYSNAEGFPQRALRIGLRLSPKSVTTKALLVRDFPRILGFSVSPWLCGELFMVRMAGCSGWLKNDKRPGMIPGLLSSHFSNVPLVGAGGAVLAQP